MTISVRVASGESVGKSPYVLKNVYEENCFCPQDGDAFSSAMMCPAQFDQIDQDLSRFQSVDLDKTIPESIERFSNKMSACFAHYSIIDNKVS